MNLYRIKFNDFGTCYVVAEDWNSASKITEDYYPDGKIKEIEIIASNDDKEKNLYK